MQLQLYNNNKESFIAAMGQEAYDNKTIELLDKLPVPDPVQVPIGCGDENNNEDEDKEEEEN